MQWYYHRSNPSKEVVKEIISMVVEIAIITLWQNYCYDFGGETHLQKEGGPIGQRPTMAASRLVVQDFMEEYKKILSKAGLDIPLLKVYVDDGRQVTSIMKKGNRTVADFFSFKMKPHQVSWLPCEVEALAICSAASHFSCYIRESLHATQILTHSKPCVQAWQKLCRGCFSASARVSTFLSTLSSLNIVLCHIKGTENGISDYSSRHPVQCSHCSCQI